MTHLNDRHRQDPGTGTVSQRARRDCELEELLRTEAVEAAVDEAYSLLHAAKTDVIPAAQAAWQAYPVLGAAVAEILRGPVGGWLGEDAA